MFKNPPPGLNCDGTVATITPTIQPSSVEYLLALEKEVELAEGLPFLHGWKWYPWARDFFESTNRINLLCAANQISKSSTQIRKCIHWATAFQEWPRLWILKPAQFWYLYPTSKQVNAEFETKWKQFLPKGEFKNDPIYGWKEEKSRGDVVAIHFNSGVHVYFKTYAQNVDSLQSGTCDAIFCDEELPIDLYEELMFRISASDGYFHMVFTATIGQDFWRRALEPGENENETLPQAFKKTVSLYDAMYYEDGTNSHWTAEKIAQVRARCSTESEVQKRVYGRFIVVGGRKYESFDIHRHLKPKHHVPPGWLIYAAADHGSGGQSGHPAALCYVAVRPDFRAGRVFLGWRGDGIDTTPGDVVQKHIDLKKENKLSINRQFYDWGSKDFFNIAARMGEPFEPAEKGHEIGEDVLNTLFKHDMLIIYEDEETVKLASEFATLKKLTPKNKAKDDFTDACRYACTKVPWDWSFITGAPGETQDNPEDKLTPNQVEVRDRRAAFEDGNSEHENYINEEFSEWNDLYG